MIFALLHTLVGGAIMLRAGGEPIALALGGVWLAYGLYRVALARRR
jgi:hypothetical protein